MTTPTLLRGRLLGFLDCPRGIDDAASHRYESDGGLLVIDGRIAAAGSYGAVRAAAPAGVREVDHRPHLIMPGFVDPHIHFPQMQVIASYASSLLEWLETYTFVEEQRFVGSGPCRAHGAACSSTSWCATARRPRRPTARCTRPPPTPSSPRA